MLIWVSVTPLNIVMINVCCPTYSANRSLSLHGRCCQRFDKNAWILFSYLAAYTRIWGTLHGSLKERFSIQMSHEMITAACTQTPYTLKRKFLHVCIFFGMPYNSIWCFKIWSFVEKWHKCVSQGKTHRWVTNDKDTLKHTHAQSHTVLHEGT